MPLTARLADPVLLSPLRSSGVGQVRPYAVTRVAALPAHAVTTLRSPRLDSALRGLALHDAAHAAGRDALSAQLHVAIGEVADRRARGRLLHLRRALYHGDAPPAALLRDAEAALPAPVATAVRAAAELLQARAAARAAVRATHAEALAEARACFQTALGDPDFQKGLLLSSRALSGNLARYRAAPPARFTSRDEQVERGLLRYFARAVMKATPFARFCAVGEGVLGDADGGPARPAPDFAFDADPAAKRGHVRLNKTLYATFWGHLKTRPAVRRALAVDLNPTLGLDGGRLHFLAAVDGREVFQRVARAEAVDAVIAHVRRHPHATLGARADALAADPAVEATPEQAVAYLDALVGHGLLRFRSFVPEQLADWDAPLGAALAAIDDDHARRVAAVLAEVRALADCYAATDVSAREALAERVRAALLTAFTDLGLAAELPRALPVFEDASTAARLHVARGPAVDAALARLAEWVALTQPLAHPRAEQATMRHFFDAYYGMQERPAVQVPLLRFYEEFYREHFKGHLEKERAARRRPDDPELRDYDVGNPFGLARVRALREASARLVDVLRERWAAAPDAEAIALEPDDVREALGDLASEPPPPVCRSASTFAQLVPPAAGANAGAAAGALVMPNGQYFVGFGKYFSRFLYMLPETLQARVLADNAALAGGDVLAEVCGDAHFNANLHPPLLPWEISYPTGESASHAGQVPGAALDVTPDPDDAHALRLVDRRTGQRVLPVDLGFLNPQMRPPLYQLLMRFTPGGTFGLMPPETPEPPRPALAEPDAAPVEPPLGPRVVYRPRVVFGGALVLARRRWTVPGVLVPRQEAAEDDGDYLVRVDGWRRAHGLPVEGYVRVVPELGPGRPGAPNTAPGTAADAAPEAETGPDTGVADGVRQRPADRPSRDWHKPQYLDFASPLFVRLFSRIAGELPAFRLHIEERYPGPDALPTFGGEAYVSELVLQVDLPTMSSSAVPAPAAASV